MTTALYKGDRTCTADEIQIPRMLEIGWSRKKPVPEPEKVEPEKETKPAAKIKTGTNTGGGNRL